MAEAKLEIKIGEIKIELEGPSDFVSNHYDKIEKHLETYVKLSKTTEKPKAVVQATETTAQANGTATETPSETIVTSELPETFGEWLNAIPKDTSDTRKALLAGYYTQLNSETKTFRSRDISRLLKEHSIKLSNTSQFVKKLAENKKTFQHSKNGNEANYKVSRDMEAELKKMFE
ncbi:hypothetical protein [Patiriisocius hiemis]|uniref:Uncharacterized protein n=1 Tax=Patiriisocius hiemis TaxID=3075604 RepID=A0ABU2YA30_9FLAO|nr:hypothetical protein [Constantimarinum sp. W242]MDT0555052.1 hypothetical protein [Constantimarinum sp. W242]